MIFFEDPKDKNHQDENIPPSAEIAEETDKITANELDEYIRKGKNIGTTENNQRKPEKSTRK